MLTRCFCNQSRKAFDRIKIWWTWGYSHGYFGILLRVIINSNSSTNWINAFQCCINWIILSTVDAFPYWWQRTKPLLLEIATIKLTFTQPYLLPLSVHATSGPSFLFLPPRAEGALAWSANWDFYWNHFLASKYIATWLFQNLWPSFTYECSYKSQVWKSSQQLTKVLFRDLRCA